MEWHLLAECLDRSGECHLAACFTLAEHLCDFFIAFFFPESEHQDVSLL